MDEVFLCMFSFPLPGQTMLPFIERLPRGNEPLKTDTADPSGLLCFVCADQQSPIHPAASKIPKNHKKTAAAQAAADR